MYGVPLISNKIEFSHDNNLNIVFDNAEKIKEYLYSSLYSNNWKKDANKAIFKSKEFLNKVSSIDFEIFNNN
jgi:small nuclear ribonucleoprotein (snRNP)-like protein